MANICLPRCFEPTFRSCSEPYPDEVSLCCFEIGFPNDYTTTDDPPETLDCSRGVYSCDPGSPYGIFHSVTNYTGIVGASYAQVYQNEYQDVLTCDDTTIVAKRYGWHGFDDRCWRFVYSGAVTCAQNLAFDYWSNVLMVPVEIIPEFVPDFVVQWECIGNGVIRIRAGITVGPLATYGGGTSCEYQYHLSDMRFFCPIFEGFFSPDWWRSNIIGPGPNYGPITLPCIDFGDPEDSLEFGISKGCDWVPCGDPLDCFASCISGTVDCDGTTPAHVPVIYFTLDVGLCCLSGTYPLTYGTGPLGGLGYHMATQVCTAFGTTFTMDVVLKCGAHSGIGGIDYGAGSNTAHLIIRITDTDDNYDLFGAVVSLSCSDGLLVEATGSITGLNCGITGNGGWAVSG